MPRKVMCACNWSTGKYPLAAGFFGYAQLVKQTSRITVEGAPPERASILVNFHHFQPLMQVIHGPDRRWMMVSRAPPLRPVARYTAWMGMRMARGATGSGGREALKELAEAIRRGDSVSIAVDGPAGPAWKVKRGCVDLAQETGAPIVPVAYECARGFQTWRWDRALNPTPFDHIVVRWGPVIEVRGSACAQSRRSCRSRRARWSGR